MPLNLVRLGHVCLVMYTYVRGL